MSSADVEHAEVAARADSEEVELKLECDAAGLAVLARHPWLAEVAEGRATTRTLRNVYLDTPDLAVWERGLVLRVRHGGARHTVGVKSGGRPRGRVVAREGGRTLLLGPLADPGRARSGTGPAFGSDPGRAATRRDRARRGRQAPGSAGRDARAAHHAEAPPGHRADRARARRGRGTCGATSDPDPGARARAHRRLDACAFRRGASPRERRGARAGPARQGPARVRARS